METSIDFRSVFETTPGCSVLIEVDTPNYTIIAVTDDYLKIASRKKEQLIGKSLFTEFGGNPNDPDFSGHINLDQSFRNVILEKKMHQLPIQRYDIADRDGNFTEHYWQATNKPILGSNGEVKYIVHTAENITEKILAAKKVKQLKSFTLANNIFTQAQDGIFVLKGEDLVIEIANDTILELWGKDTSIIGQPLLVALPEIEDQGFLEILRDIIATGVPFRAYEKPTVLLRKGQLETVYFDFSYQPYFDTHESAASGVLVFGSDVTEKVLTKKLLEATEMRFNTIANTLPLVIWIASPDGNLTYISDQWEIFYGNSLAESLGIGWTKFVHPDDAQLAAAKWEESLRTGKTYEAEFRILSHGEKYRWLLVRALPIKDNHGKIISWYGSNTDIDANKRTEEALKESENRYRVLIEESTVATALYIGRDLKIQYANDIMLKYWDKAPSIIGGTLAEALPELQGQPFLGYLDDVYLTGVPHVGFEDKATLLSDGALREFYFNYTYKAIRSQDGQIYGIHQMAVDVTEQVLAKEALKKSEAEFRNLADSLPEMVWTTDHLGKQTFASKRWQSYTGLDPYDAATFEKMVHPDDLIRIMSIWEASLKNGHTYTAELRLKSKDGDYQWFFVNGESIRNEDGVIEKWAGAFTNINEQKKAEEELLRALQKLKHNEKRLEKKVAKRTKDLSQAKQVLEENNAMLKTMNKELESFAYISSHDLQEPLRKIQTFASRIMETDYERLSQNAKSYFERIQNAGLRMQTLIDDLLAYSRTNTEARKFEKIGLGELIDEIKVELSEDLEVYKATIETIDVCDVHIISFQFRQLLHNLIGNALKFSRPESAPHIVIKCQTDFGQNFNHHKLVREKQYCLITISDNGIGFEPEYGERIFEVFQRLHGKDKYNGTGIGLAIVKKIIDNHDGVIHATGAPGHGATFDIYIPAIGNVVML